MPTDPARLVAFDVLRAVADADAYANIELSRLLRERRVSGRDAALATELVGGTLRMRGAYDAVIDQLVDRRLDEPVRDALRLGVHQLLAMRVPSHAAVGTTVDLVKKRIGHRPAGLVNAVLRKAAGRSLEEWLAGHPVAERFSHPAWVVSALERALARPDELEALLRADNERPAVTLVARPGLATRDELGGTPLAVSPYAVALAGGDPGALAAVREGRAGVQDAGSQLVALVLARASVEGNDRRWLDLCAGPGGKTALLAALAVQQGARVLANERQPHRARLVAQATRAATAGLLGVVAGDGTRPAWPAAAFDRSLVDAPCTGLGALRRRPESRWRREPSDIGDLVTLQAALLDAAIESTRPGGVVVYATCSPVVEETAGVVSRVLGERADVRLEPATALLPEVDDAESAHLDGAVQLWPHRHGTDAMFVAVLRRTGESDATAH
ncbi:RsmB/NOP family class I SAM-dependent RNA methyltransferase [Nocardioides pocheonensis]|uniref:rRNA cytosine-C5-methyltransferase n=1 Tax=Nocardioides pocheonensis TaxID=661485 RepID=A0A3N0GEZ9_9ACTN|nr:RsmB/NOP family class I SAM-dependent RNA methyltransferase [Nocardioides pocheonensis]RNM11043.1 rRNA cytosine-C5-methyltransferase [Nocardioides pocheonensis]